MRRAERLFRIIALVRDGAVHTAAELAIALEVGERTIYRDIAHLQASGVGIDGVAGLGYIADPNLEIPPLNFTLAEFDALALGLGFPTTRTTRTRSKNPSQTRVSAILVRAPAHARSRPCRTR